MADEYPGMGGVQPEGIWDVFQGRSTGGVDFWAGDVSAEPSHGSGPEKFPTQGRAADHGETDEETGKWRLVLSTAGGSNVGGGLRGERVLHPKEVEHGHTIYCDATEYGTM